MISNNQVVVTREAVADALVLWDPEGFKHTDELAKYDDAIGSIVVHVRDVAVDDHDPVDIVANVLADVLAIYFGNGTLRYHYHGQSGNLRNCAARIVSCTLLGEGARRVGAREEAGLTDDKLARIAAHALLLRGVDVAHDEALGYLARNTEDGKVGFDPHLIASPPGYIVQIDGHVYFGDIVV